LRTLSIFWRSCKSWRRRPTSSYSPRRFHRVRAEALQRLEPRSQRVEEEYRTAVQIARRQGAAALELRAACGWANKLSELGRADEALRLLGPLYEQFPKGIVTPDLRTAAMVLGPPRLTTEVNARMAPVHTRLPVVLGRSCWGRYAVVDSCRCSRGRPADQELD